MNLVSMRQLKEKPLLALLFALSLALLLYTGYRAACLSMTHDESVSYLWFKDLNVGSCFYDEACWPSANNHLLNTFLFQVFTNIFGISELTIRLPNVTAHAVYLLCSTLLLLKATERSWLILSGFIMININPYLLDFFSLARGYGICAGLTMASIFFYMSYISEQRFRGLIFTYIAAFSAVLANFVALNFLASLIASTVILSTIRYLRNETKFSLLLKETSIPLITASILAFLLYRPIQFLQGGGEFAYGAPQLSGTFVSLTRNTLYDAAYLGVVTVDFFFWIFVIAVIAAIFGGVHSYLKKPEESWRINYLFATLLFLFGCLVMLFQRWLLGSDFLIDRKALLFVPVCAVLFFYFLYWMRNKKVIPYVALLLSVSLSYHFFRTMNFTKTLEWWYDKETKAMMNYMSTVEPGRTEPIKLGLSWHFQPSSQFYHKLYRMESIASPPFFSEIITDGRFDYYYIFNTDLDKLKEQYEIERAFGAGKLLLRKKKSL